MTPAHLFHVLSGNYSHYNSIPVLKDALEPSDAAATPRGQARLLLEKADVFRGDSTTFFEGILGGTDRVKQLDEFFEDLTKKDASLYICTKGLTSTTRLVLQKTGLLKHFSQVYGNVSYSARAFDRASEDWVCPDESVSNILEMPGDGWASACENAGKQMSKASLCHVRFFSSVMLFAMLAGDVEVLRCNSNSSTYFWH